MSNVLNDVLKKCRKALVSGMPILYIKTDSDIFIKKLVMSEENMLVVLLSSGGAHNDELNILRPLYELQDGEDKQLKYCKNYSYGVPSKDKNAMLYKGIDVSTENTKYAVPHIWVKKISSFGDEADIVKSNKDIFESLREYVSDYHDVNHPQYDVLHSSAVIIYSADIILPEYLKLYTEFIDVKYPDEGEIKSIIEQILGNDDFGSGIPSMMLGFTVEEVELISQRIQALSSFYNLDDVKKIIQERKSQKMQGSIIEECAPDGHIGGMKNFKDWLDGQKDPLRKAASYMKSLGTPPPKGVLLCGIPGCGKSEAAKFAARTLGFPLLKIDIGSLMDKYLGVAEQRMRDALKTAEAMSPCVLWIDELEKGFSGAKSDSSDSPSFKRMFAYMLGWMQENKSPVFIFATANDIGGLPKEFFRSGRFSGLYAVYLPTREECADIFLACMDKAEHNAARARGITDESVRLFESGCREKKIFYEIIDNKFTEPDNTPRMLIGSDIQNLVNIALRKLSRETEFFNNYVISGSDWKNALNEVADKNFKVYGDSFENVESIAVSYCRMLRKGFNTVSNNILFKYKDYHIENARLVNEDNNAREVLQEDTEMRSNLCKYDLAVYDCLRKEINSIAVLIEKRERDILITGK
ncbi:MAG: AAA family ATPase [Synergistaceae bacterium]|nr:AAA family ATPase [Synergistaceae bacterium]MBQ7570568.1 AAA family ATPase [Synergistaceae bacterium]MBQ9582267.1 AAA family ATPase [Synergistaceae bacterium]MBR0044945.1 AAA family ATPase [Synergistaceae bacterium]MBR0096391.1 AAA family ATPase [Synergistaceae bacterium]